MSSPNTRGLRTRAATGLATLGLLASGGIAGLAIASPAQAACNSDVRVHNFWGSRAEAHTEDCAYWSYSYAQHGGASAASGWYSGWSRATADVGVSTSHNAWNIIE